MKLTRPHFRAVFSFAILLFFLIVLHTDSNAQSTGSIFGTVIDASDNSPLTGAIVKIVGSNKGAEADENGEYVIQNVDPGIYDLEATYVTYQKQKVTGVRVSVDSRTEANFSLAGEFTVEEVVVEAERKGINVTESGRLINEEQIENSGIRGIQNIASKTAGAVTDERGINLNVRGGRSNENLVIIDGVATTNPVDGSSNAFVPNSLLQELAILTGGFGAEYGNALSGIINVTTKGGTDVYSGSIEAITDEFNGDWNNTTVQGYNLYNISLGGPLIPSKGLERVINFYGGVERQYLQVQNPSWVADQLFEDAIIPNTNQKLWNYSGRLNFNLGEIKDSKIPVVVKLGALVTDNNQRVFIQSYWKTNSGRNPLRLIRDNQYYGRISHEISSNFYYEVQANYYHSTNELGDAFFLGDWFAYGDTNSNPTLLAQQRASNNELQGTVLGNDENTANVFRQDGRVYDRYLKQELSYVGGKLDAQWQLLTKKAGDHEIKFGGEYRYNTLKKVDLRPAATANNPLDSAGNTTQNPASLWFGRDVLLNSYGYDIRDQYGNQIVSDDDINGKNPIIAAAYLRDKISFGDFSVNAGVRMDYLDVNTDVLVSPFDLVGADGLLLSDDDYEPSEANIFVSPRLGFSFPVTDKTVFVANYGKFVQMPPLNFLYINKLAFQSFFSNSVQNVAENSALKPEQLTSYEVGFKQQVGDYVDFGLTAYYRETIDQIGITKIAGSTAPPIKVPQGYALYFNSDFSTSRGLDFYLSMRRINRLAVDISYTLLFASGVGSDPNTKFQLANDPDGQLPKFEFPLDYDQRHTGNFNIDYRFGQTDVPKGFFGEILKGMGLNALFSFNSGRPYTVRGLPTQGFSLGVGTDDGDAVSSKNQVYTGWNLRLDMRLDKSVKIWKTNWNFYLYALNVTNSELVNQVYGSTGIPGDNGYLSTPTGASQSALYKENFNERIKDITNWGTPRQIRFGVKLSF